MGDTEVTRTLHKGREHDMMVVQGWYEHYTSCTSVIMLHEVCVEGWVCPESVSWIPCVNVAVWGVVEKLGKGLRQPDEGRS